MGKGCEGWGRDVRGWGRVGGDGRAGRRWGRNEDGEEMVMRRGDLWVHCIITLRSSLAVCSKPSVTIPGGC